MPLYKTITVNQHTKVLIWKIEESFETLSKVIDLTPYCQNRLSQMKSEMHRRGFMSVRHLLAHVNYQDSDLYYDDFGKPYLKDGTQISITHSFEFAAIIISNQRIGIDIEKQREKIKRIAHKFTNDKEADFISKVPDVAVRLLTIIWGAKESLYKLYATAGLSFEQHIQIPDFKIEDGEFIGAIEYQNSISAYKIMFLEFEGFTCVYASAIQE